jgi:hypothetical protein
MLNSYREKYNAPIEVWYLFEASERIVSHLINRKMIFILVFLFDSPLFTRYIFINTIIR